MYYFLFALYLFFGCYIITRINFVRKAGIPIRIVLTLFLIKIFAGVFVGWISFKFSPVNDYSILNQESIKEYALIFSDPHEFFTNIFRSPYPNAYGGFFNSVGSYWNDLRSNIIIKILACCNILSHGNYYINSLFFNFFGFFGHVALFRLFSGIYKNKMWPVIIGCFLLPSTLYFSSGVHKDLIIFTMLGFYFYALYFSVIEKFTYRRLMIIFLSLVVILLIRNFIIIALLPASVTFILSERKRINPLISLAVIYFSGFMLFAVLQFFIPGFEPLKILIQKQSDFLDLPAATSQLVTHTLEPHLKSFFINAPWAFDHGFLRPYISENKGPFLFMLAVELLVYEILLITGFFQLRKVISKHSFVLSAQIFSITMLLIIGYIIPNIGSIVRYKSIYLPFILTPVLCSLKRKTAIL